MGSIPPEPRYIVIGYQGDRDGQCIRDADVISARGLHYSDEEVSAFQAKSTARCPTYGNCSHCLRSGPVGKHCNTCNEQGYLCRHEAVYKVVYIEESVTRTAHIIDARKLALTLGNTHEHAMADRTQYWLTTPSMLLTRDDMRHISTQWRHVGTRDPDAGEQIAAFIFRRQVYSEMTEEEKITHDELFPPENFED